MENFMVYELRSNFWQAWNQSLHKVWETTMNTQQRCGRMSKITENWLNIAVFGHMEHFNRSNVGSSDKIVQDVWTQHISPITIRAPTNLQTYLKDRQSQHYIDVIMTTMASQITSLTVVYSTVKSKKTSKLRVTGLCVGNSPGPVNSPHKGPVTRKMFPFDDVIMRSA